MVMPPCPAPPRTLVLREPPRAHLRLLQIDGRPFCPPHFLDLRGSPCARCSKPVAPGEQLTVLKRAWHPECLVCEACSRRLTSSDRIFPREDRPVCEACFMAAADRCTTCDQPIIGKYLKALGRKYHPEKCLACVACMRCFGEGEKMYQRDGWPVCAEHARGELPPGVEERMRAGAGGTRPDDASSTG